MKVSVPLFKKAKKVYNVSTIKTALLGVNNWRQNANASGWQLTAMTTGTSGIAYNDYHPLLAFDNIQQIAPDFDTLHPVDASARNTAFTAWLQGKTEGWIAQTVEEWFLQKSGLKTAGSMIDRRDLFTASGSVSETESLLSSMTGIEIKPTRSLNLRLLVEKLSLQFDTNNSVTVYLFKAGTSAAVKSEAFTYNTAPSVQWFTPATDWEIKGEGVYYLCYDASLLSGNYINGVKDHHYQSAGYTTFPDGKFYLATAFHVDADGETTLWDIRNNIYTLDTNYGLNVSLSVHCDYTDLIVEQKDLFKTAVALKVAIEMLSELLHNPQSNINNNVLNVSKNDVYLNVFGDTPENAGHSLSARYKRALDAIAFDQSNIDAVCLPCRKEGVKWTSVGPVGYPLTVIY